MSEKLEVPPSGNVDACPISPPPAVFQTTPRKMHRMKLPSMADDEAQRQEEDARVEAGKAEATEAATEAAEATEAVGKAAEPKKEVAKRRSSKEKRPAKKTSSKGKDKAKAAKSLEEYFESLPSDGGEAGASAKENTVAPQQELSATKKGSKGKGKLSKAASLGTEDTKEQRVANQVLSSSQDSDKGSEMKKPMKRSSSKMSAGQTDIREHFSGRTSTRLSSRGPKKEEIIADLLRNKKDPEGLAIVDMPGKGKGVIAGKAFEKGDYVCEYSGDLITKEESIEREKMYAEEDAKAGRESVMCYMYFLKHAGKSWCVDATKSGRIGRLINHSRLNPNLVTKLFIVDNIPHLGLVACKDIPPGVELLYDYGERDPVTIAAHPWLAL